MGRPRQGGRTEDPGTSRLSRHDRGAGGQHPEVGVRNDLMTLVACIRSAAAFAGILCLVACGGRPTLAPATFTVGGSVSGLQSGRQIILLDNNTDSLTVGSNGPFTFNDSVSGSGGFAVTIGTQPTGQTCSLSNASSASITANVTNVIVACAGAAQFAYVVNSSANTVSEYTVGSDGSLTPVRIATVATGKSPQSITISAVESFAYVANLSDNTVSQYTIA